MKLLLALLGGSMMMSFSATMVVITNWSYVLRADTEKDIFITAGYVFLLSMFFILGLVTVIFSAKELCTF